MAGLLQVRKYTPKNRNSHLLWERRLRRDFPPQNVKRKIVFRLGTWNLELETRNLKLET